MEIWTDEKQLKTTAGNFLKIVDWTSLEKLNDLFTSSAVWTLSIKLLERLVYSTYLHHTKCRPECYQYEQLLLKGDFGVS